MAMFRSLGRLLPSLRSAAHPFSHALHRPPAFATAPLSSAVPPNKQPFTEDFSKMTNEELVDTSTIPGWDLVVNPPRNWPRGALVGTVVSTRMQKTINVAVDRYRIVHKIKKRKRYTRKFFAHDEDEVANLGDMVMIAPCQRITRHKHFMLREIIKARPTLTGEREIAEKKRLAAEIKKKEEAAAASKSTETKE